MMKIISDIPWDTSPRQNAAAIIYYDYTPYPHKSQKVFGTIARHNSVFEHYDTLCFYRNGNNATSPIANNSVCRYAFGERSIIIAPGGRPHFFSYEERYRAINDSSTVLYANGKRIVLPYSEIYAPCIDMAGNYALLGKRGYYLYKNINGIEQKEPLSKHDVRAKPISVDTKGNTICYYETDDSVYVYENDRLFKACAAGQFSMTGNVFALFGLNEQKDISQFWINDECYLVYKNSISPPLQKMSYSSDWPLKYGHVIGGDVNEHGYWLLQKVGYRKYLLLINNRKIDLPADVDLESKIWVELVKNYRLSNKDFIFYTEQKGNIYRYTIQL